MKIDILHQYYLKQNEGGGSRFNQFAKYWSENNEINVFAGMVNYTTGRKGSEYKGKIFVTEKESEKITINRVHVSQSYNRSFLGRLWGYFSFTFFSTIKMLFSKSGDILIATSPPLTVACTALIIKKIKRIPLVFEIRDLWPESAIQTGVLKNKFLIKFSYWIEKITYRNADIINVLTPAFKDVLINDKGVNEKKIIFIPNGADLDLMKPDIKNNIIREKYRLENKFVILYTGAHGIANNLFQLIYTAEKLKNYQNIVFMLIGDGMEKEELKLYAKNHGLNNVIFVDSVPKHEIGNYINAADVCTAILKKNDVFKTVYPNKVFDYMACKRPIIVGIDGIARKLIVEDAKAGFYVEPENTDKFVETIIKMYSDRHGTEEMGNNGYEFVNNNFSRKSLGENYLNYLKKII